MLNKVLLEQFDEFKKQTDKYLDLNLEKILFDKIELDSIVNFINGFGGYTKKYNEHNPGKFPLMTGALEVKFHVSPIKEKHIINKESVSYNKDNDAGSQAYYHNNPYIVGAHHHALLIKEEEKDRILVKYLYYTMKNIFNNHNFYQSKNVATSSLIKTFKISIPQSTENYSSLQIQEAIVEFFDRTEMLRAKMYDLEEKTHKLYEAIISKIFLLNDPFVVDKFDKWAEKNLYNIKASDLVFEPKALKTIADFPVMAMALGKPDLKIKEYASLSKDEQADYIPLIGGTLTNNQVSGYFHINNIRKSSITEPNIISWTRINGKHFFIQKEPVCTNDDSYIMKVNDANITEFVKISLMVFMRNHSANWGDKIGKRKMMEIEIMVPKAIKEFDSLDIQKILIEFIESFQILKNKTFTYASTIIENSEKLDKVFLYELFKDEDEN